MSENHPLVGEVAGRPMVVTIDALDPSGASGLLANCRVVETLGCRSAGLVTANWVADSSGVRRCEPVTAEVIGEQLPALFADIEINAVLIGVLPSVAVASLVADAISQTSGTVIWNPRFMSRSGVALALDAPGRIGEEIGPQCDVITASVIEFAILGIAVDSVDKLGRAGTQWAKQFDTTVLAMGGDVPMPLGYVPSGDDSRSPPSFIANILCQNDPDGQANSGNKLDRQDFPMARRRGPYPRGLSATFSAALACHLARSIDLDQAIERAQSELESRWEKAAPVGRGLPFLA